MVERKNIQKAKIPVLYELPGQSQGKIFALLIHTTNDLS